MYNEYKMELCENTGLNFALIYMIIYFKCFTREKKFVSYFLSLSPITFLNKIILHLLRLRERIIKRKRKINKNKSKEKRKEDRNFRNTFHRPILNGQKRKWRTRLCYVCTIFIIYFNYLLKE